MRTNVHCGSVVALCTVEAMGKQADPGQFGYWTEYKTCRSSVIHVEQ